MTNNLRIPLLSFLFCILLFSVSGCMKASLPFYYYTLENPQQTPASQGYRGNVVVGPVHIASFLNKGQLVRQNSEYSITIEEQHRWAGNLQEMLSNALINNLSLDLGTNNVVPFPDNRYTNPVQIEITFLHFEEDVDGNALLQTRWNLIDVNQTILYSAKSTYSVDPKETNYRARVQGLSATLSRLSKEIAEGIRENTIH